MARPAEVDNAIFKCRKCIPVHGICPYGLLRTQRMYSTRPLCSVFYVDCLILASFVGLSADRSYWLAK